MKRLKFIFLAVFILCLASCEKEKIVDQPIQEIVNRNSNNDVFLIINRLYIYRETRFKTEKLNQNIKNWLSAKPKYSVFLCATFHTLNVACYRVQTRGKF